MIRQLAIWAVAIAAIVFAAWAFVTAFIPISGGT